MASVRVLRVLGLAAVATAASVTNCGGAHDHLSDVSINLVPDPISRTTPFTLTLSGTLDEDLTGGELDVSLEVRALRVIDKVKGAGHPDSWRPAADDELPVRQTSESTIPSGKSEREKVEEFALQRETERMRSFYFVLQLAFATLFTGVVITALTDLLWRNLPAGRTPESIISAMSVVGWFLTAASITIASTCPMDELDLNCFMHSRPLVCALMAIPPLSAAVPRVLERPYGRWLSCLVGLTLLARGCACKPCKRHLCSRSTRRWLPSFCTLMEIWYLDTMLAVTLTEMALNEPLLFFDIWSAFTTAVAFILAGWLRWRRKPPTLRFYAVSYAALMNLASYHTSRAIEMALGSKEWEEGRQLDIAIMAAFAFAVALALPLLVVWVLGRRRLFLLLSEWLDQRRGQKLQDGAFMAMLLDSYLVELGQPWWLSSEDLSDLPLVSQVPGPVIRPHVSHTDLEAGSERPGFTVARVTALVDDGSFYVRTDDGRPEVRINQKQQVLPWPVLLQLASKNLRCVDWVSQSPADWRESSGPGFRLSRPVSKGEAIDFFVSHSWSDGPERKWRALQLVAELFYAQHGRYPTFWVDKFCIDQCDVADGLRVLPVNVMACRKVLVLCGRTYPTRLWCAWELCVLLSFMSLEMALKQLVVLPLSQSALGELAKFDSSVSRCFNPNEELRLRRVINAIGKARFESKIRAVGQLILDRELNGKGLMMDTAGGLGDRFRYQLSGSSFASDDDAEDSLVEVVF